MKIKNEVEILWWERKLISREGYTYRAYAFYKGTTTPAWENMGEDLNAVLDKLSEAVIKDGLTIVSINKGN